MSLKDSLIAAAAAGFALGLASQHSELLAEEAAVKPPPKNDQCFGINSCKGKNSCGVSKEQIKVANEKFKNKYTKSKSLECSGTSSGSAKKGVLAWVQKNDAEECLKAGGFVFEKDSARTLVIRNSKI